MRIDRESLSKIGDREDAVAHFLVSHRPAEQHGPGLGMAFLECEGHVGYGALIVAHPVMREPSRMKGLRVIMIERDRLIEIVDRQLEAFFLGMNEAEF
jgi:hypothetical protein